ncbi:hypothetical protein JCM9534A_66390 [Catenuloplanes indicus JCM 9534]|uniref:Uncharacterized protein n=1 Tax=Catenuloplanes indicus TaxID=137267 RepID=A0AAE3W7U2_9ACTN|nr:hypothetical protein [Catenuloplanes indicus]MDQ0370887.1 hypothetical protein [Catenuloplanes indicus]
MPVGTSRTVPAAPFAPVAANSVPPSRNGFGGVSTRSTTGTPAVSAAVAARAASGSAHRRREPSGLSAGTAGADPARGGTGQ